jgi:uncharacterized repeat protein (TIGR02543 family)
MKTRQYTLMLVAIFTMVTVLVLSGCKKETYTVTFNANGGVGEMQVQIFTEGKSQPLAINEFTYHGYIFEGWNTTSNGSGTSYEDMQRIIVTSDMTLYAQWKKISSFVKVTFDANGGTGEMRPQQYVAGSPQVLRPNAFSKPDYYFHNWNTEADGSGTAYANTQEITVSRNITLYAQWGKKYVDLGLPSGTLWAICNVGADVPEEFGDYFAWGETEPKETYTQHNYKFGYGIYSKYNNNDLLQILDPCDDAANVNWGADWRMPTYNELNELLNYCTHTWTVLNGIDGRMFVGPNGNSIFLPAAGFRFDDQDVLYYPIASGYYWSSNVGWGQNICDAYLLYIDEDDIDGDGFENSMHCHFRPCGFSVRPVYQPNN